MTTPFLITGYQHSLRFCQAFEREWGREILRSKTPNFAPSTLCFGGLPRGPIPRCPGRYSYFKLNRHTVSIGANQTFSILFFIFLGKAFGILILVSSKYGIQYPIAFYFFSTSGKARMIVSQ